MILVDTDVLIEFRRGSPQATNWVSSLGDLILPVPGIVALEFIAGSINRPQLDRSIRFVENLDVRWHSEADNQLAYELVKKYRLATGLSLQDFIIAAQAVNLGATLYSFNLKHFRALEGPSVESPYPRT